MNVLDTSDEVKNNLLIKFTHRFPYTLVLTDKQRFPFIQKSIFVQNEARKAVIFVSVVVGWLIGFYGISTFVGY